MKKIINNQDGFLIPGLIALIISFGVLTAVAATVINSTLGSATKNENNQKAMNVAEAGINYYLWHMSHNPTDYTDGNSGGTPDPDYGYGPYTHDYIDSTGSIKGTFTLHIKPDANGSNIATIRSTGRTSGQSDVERTLQAKIGAPSFSTYSILGNSELWIGESESADGPVHSNVGVKIDGSSNSDVTSANETYRPSSSSGPGSGTTKPGVWCDPTITNPDCATRSKVSWRYPVTAVDFNKLSADLCTMKKDATNNQASNSCTKKPSRTASYIPPRNNSYSNQIGYLITLNSDGTYNLSNVNSENDTKSSYTNALSTSMVQNNIAIPSDGVIFAEDNVWVRSATDGFDGRVTIASARLAVTGGTTVTIVDNLKYKDKYSGLNSIGIITENNIDIAPYVPVPLEINAALIAQGGRVQFRPNYNYNGGNSPGFINQSQTLSFFGSVASNEQWTWSWIRCSNNSVNCWSGFKYNTTAYDDNLRYNPPPNFPVTSSYDILEWREVLTNP